MKLLTMGMLSLLAAMAGAEEKLKISYPQLDNPYYTAARRYVAEAYRRIGIAVEFIGMPGERSLVSSDSGVTDAELLRIKPLPGNYPNLVPVATPLHSQPITVFTIKEHFQVSGWESLRPYTIGTWRGFKLVESKTEGMKRQFALDAEGMFKMLARDRVDVVVQDSATGLMWVRRLGLGSSVRMMEPPLQMSTTYHYLNKKYAELAPRLARVFAAMHQEGLFERYQNEAEREADLRWKADEGGKAK